MKPDKAKLTVEIPRELWKRSKNERSTPTET